MNTIKAILFDLDETLLVEWKSAEEAFGDTIALLDCSIDKEEFVRVIRAAAKKLWYELPTIEYCLRIGISSWEGLWADFSGEDPNLKLLSTLRDKYRLQCWQQSLETFGISNPEAALESSRHFFTIRNAKHTLFPDTLTTLHWLYPRYKLGLITNGAPDLQRKKIEGSGLRGFFENIVISGDYGIGKPDVRLFEIALEQLKSLKEQVLIVGDSLKNDIGGGHAAGIKTVWLNRNQNKKTDILPDYEIKDLSGLLKILDSEPPT
jgi:putative hydrolase of the HAD superfamily